MKPLTLFLLLSLSACSPQLAAFSFTHGSSSVPLAPAAPTVICTASMTAEVPKRPALPPTAGFPAPTTPEAGQAVSTYLAWLHDLASTFNILAQRAEDTRQFCLSHQPK